MGEIDIMHIFDKGVEKFNDGFFGLHFLKLSVQTRILMHGQTSHKLFKQKKNDKLYVNQTSCLLHGIGGKERKCLLLEFLPSGPVCWRTEKLSYGRGAGTVPSLGCPSHRPDRHASLCYKRCRDGYKNFGCCICYKGWSTYGRGVGIALVQQCPSHRPDLHVGLCYKKCRTGYTGVSSYVDTKSTWMVVFKVFSGST